MLPKAAAALVIRSAAQPRSNIVAKRRKAARATSIPAETHPPPRRNHLRAQPRALPKQPEPPPRPPPLPLRPAAPPPPALAFQLERRRRTRRPCVARGVRRPLLLASGRARRCRSC